MQGNNNLRDAFKNSKLIEMTMLHCNIAKTRMFCFVLVKMHVLLP